MNVIVEKLSEGKEVHGVLSPSSDPLIVEMLGIAGYDYFMIEGEHRNPTNIEEVCRAAEAVGIIPLARVRSNDPKLILQFLDTGLKGIMLPGVREACEVVSFVQAMKYPPDGIRGFGPSRANNFLMDNQTVKSITEEANQDLISIVQIETKEAYENLGEILNVGGIGTIVVGTADLSLSMGLESSGDQMQTIVTEIIGSCNRKEIPVGLVASHPQEIKLWRNKGVKFFIDTLGSILKRGSNQESETR